MDNQIKELPNVVTKCPTISTLLLQGNKMFSEVPDHFVRAFTSLKILDLSYCDGIKSLPAYLERLVDLRALFLKSCQHLETLPPLGGLAKLQVLVCSGTSISALPQGMEKLRSLRRLDLSYNSKLTVIPCGVMSGLSNLEYLDMRWSRVKFIGERGEISNLFKEILPLDRLIVLLVDVDSSASTLETTKTLLNKMMKFKRFEIFISSDMGFPDYRAGSKKLFFLNIHVRGERMAWLFANSTNITFKGCGGLDMMFANLVANRDEVGSFDSVKLLSIIQCKDGFGVGSHAKFDMLPNLEEIWLDSLTNLSCILDLALPLGLKFSKLRYITVSDCPELKYLIPLGTTVPSLEKLELVFCKQVEEVFKFDKNSVIEDTSITVFPKLRMIKLLNCPRLRLLNAACPRLENLYVWRCPLLKKLPLTAQNVGTFKEIRGEQEWWDQLEWENDDIKNNLQHCFRPH
ncbi:UNVERIFIED_CONTAM: hypothetical protein Sradi_0541200 [Sesamum radiatum]|uniref:Disease resistance R13L4/SHOC-2-like LRR domain-containing protein n=1 Tax=Sesamum radiatum TaxID=300843 RepID=A0AAW2VLP8_SESRA